MAGEKADVFASADLGNAITLNQNNLSGEVKTFARNPLYAIAIPEVSLTTENLLDTFLNPDIKLSIAQPVSDPLGDYGIQIFRQAEDIRPGSFALLDAKAIRLSGTLPQQRNSPGGSIVYYLQDINRADIYLVYYTSALSAREISPSLEIVELPDSLKVQADYGLTVLKGATPEGSQLANYILSPTGQQILAKYGFSSPKSVRESQGVGGILLAVSVAFALHRRLMTAKQQKVQAFAAKNCEDCRSFTAKRLRTCDGFKAGDRFRELKLNSTEQLMFNTARFEFTNNVSV
ncbi:molybdenum ABC transporter substrate-binding protein [Scytonema sp. UIC 10036]|uniref:substrate-binding domain-containing protein n=1 Tax=Scytonema sp. UIC 10036 TaxID=2304196 RepID=UPI0012DA3917|nr:substrate-binding domain-containing protein [Scytonema sp. UIC 10036]MUG93488.1 molybdenum ABC transporter substrate-binding protein [Scytonema sp. UIC 10036]